MTSADQTAIQALIRQQLEAFQRDDAEAAFQFASPAIQAQFGTATNFLEMVRQGYAPVYRPRAVLFSELLTLEGMPAQTVMLMSANQELVEAIYLMQQQPDDSWRIHGCLLKPVARRAD